MMPSGVCSESKTGAIIREIVIPIKKQLGWGKISNKMLLDYDNFGRYLDIPSLVERCVGIVGDLEVLCEDGYDFDDYSDLKTCGVSPAGYVDIAAVGSKVGALRVVVECWGSLQYFYIPHRYIKGLINSKSQRGSIRGKIMGLQYSAQWHRNAAGDNKVIPTNFWINKIDKFAVPSFSELASFRGEETWLDLYERNR